MNPRTPLIIALCLVVISGFIVLLSHLKQEPAPAMNSETRAGHPRKSDRGSGVNSVEAKVERLAKVVTEERVREVKQTQFTFWSENASAGLAQSKNRLVADLNLSAGNAADVDRIFARREAELAGLLAAMHSGEVADDMETFREICALLRNKGLREDLVGVLSPEKMAAFDANEATRERETIEARAYRDMADINAVVLLTDSQKRRALAALMECAPEKVQREADTRAFMTLNYGQMLVDVDSSSIRGLANMVSAKLSYEMPDVDFGGTQYQEWTQTNKMERIEHELSGLQDILDQDQLTRYREHLEAEPAW